MRLVAYLLFLLLFLVQWRRRRATVRCRCRAVHNTSSTSAELGNTRKHSAAGAVTSLDRGLLTHSTDNVLLSASSTFRLGIQPLASYNSVRNKHVCLTSQMLIKKCCKLHMNNNRSSTIGPVERRYATSH